MRRVRRRVRQLGTAEELWRRKFEGREPLPRTDAEICTGWGDLDITRRVRRVLGFDVHGPKMPKDFHGQFDVDGRRVVVYRSGEAPKRLLRMYMETDEGRLVPVGRVHQAVCGVRGRRGRGPGGRFVPLPFKR